MPHGVYVHVPWCRVHCPYCAFNVVVSRDPPWADFVAAVLRDQQRFARDFDQPPDTVYLGGGTPSLLPLPHLAALLDGLPRRPACEVTLEVNPGTVDLQHLAGAAELGVTRLSLGVQTFTTRHARRLARGHDVRQAEQLLDLLPGLPIDSWSLDLMFALPEQTLAQLDDDLDRIVALAPPHVSLYGLTYEPGTPFAERRARDRLREQDDDSWRQMYDRIHERLVQAGWERYEVSNFARPGHRSRHNQATWRGGYYVGLGPGAHGYLPPTPTAPWGRRTVGAADLSAWLAGAEPQVEVLDAATSAADFLLSTLRHVDGSPLDRLLRRGQRPAESVLRALEDADLLRRRDGHLRLTARGIPLADGVTARLIAGLQPV